MKSVFPELDITVTNDSGLRWYSLSAAVPTFVIFGASDPSLTHCFTENFYELRKPVACSPCKHRICPTDFQCMLGLTPEIVFEHLRPQLQAATS
jgi:heptosyltransferase-2